MRRGFACLALALALQGMAPPVLAQAWLPTRGTLDSSVGYTNVLNRKHYLPDGSQADAGTTRIQTMAFKFQYGLSDRWTLSGGLPFVSSKYSGSRPHPGHVDDGDPNQTFTDWRLGLHYQLTEGPIALAPYLQYSAPIKSYPVLGHAAPGRGLEELWAGFFAGRDLDRWLPRSYAQLRYNYAFVEKVVGVAHDRTNIEAELGYRASARWTLRAVLLWQQTHGGIDVPIPPSDPLFPYHDQLADESFTILGAGTSWAVSSRASIYLLGMHSVRGRNGHKVDRSISVGWTQSFDIAGE
jgi:hypothetical protein